MSDVFAPGPRPRTVRDPEGRIREVPDGWDLLPPGDPALTRRVKAGEHWVVAETRGRKVFTRGVWAPAERIAAIREALEGERATESYARKRAADHARRERVQAKYEGDFEEAVLAFLDFADVHADVAREIARRVTAHATPVGSGTVARTERIPIDERAEAAVIAWMRHQTTSYDHMQIARVQGRRREVRRELAARSRALLRRYRDGLDPAPDCPLQRALSVPAPSAEPEAEPEPISGADRRALFAKLERKVEPTTPTGSARKALFAKLGRKP